MVIVVVAAPAVVEVEKEMVVEVERGGRGSGGVERHSCGDDTAVFGVVSAFSRRLARSRPIVRFGHRTEKIAEPRD